MAYVPVPKDLSRIKTKVAFNLTKRQLIFFAAALLTGLPLFFLLKDSAGTSLAAFVMILVKALQPKTTVTGKEAGQETSKKAKKKSSEMEL